MACSRLVVLEALERLAPLDLSEPWDNTGLLVDPTDRAEFARAFVTIDLTRETLGEADEFAADLIVAYHPPIFAGLKRLRRGAPGEEIVVRALRAGQTIYCPHTALDAATDGMTDWLARALGPGSTRPITPHPVVPDAGAGRLVELDAPLSLQNAVERFKAHLGLRHVRVAGGGREVKRFAVCPGAGGSVFERVGPVDLLVTGEMRHHDVLARQAAGTSVILTDHTNSERGFLPVFARRLAEACPGLEVSVSRVDADPLRIV